MVDPTPQSNAKFSSVLEDTLRPESKPVDESTQEGSAKLLNARDRTRERAGFTPHVGINGWPQLLALTYSREQVSATLPLEEELRASNALSVAELSVALAVGRCDRDRSDRHRSDRHRRNQPGTTRKRSVTG